MEVGYRPSGEAFVARYAAGDFVRLQRSERGEGPLGRLGDWGRVIAVGGKAGWQIDIEVAGYSRPRSSEVKRLTGVSTANVVPCDRHGVTVSLFARSPLFRLDADTWTNLKG